MRQPVAAIGQPQAANNLAVLRPVLVKVALVEVKVEDKEEGNVAAEVERAVSRAPASR